LSTYVSQGFSLVFRGLRLTTLCLQIHRAKAEKARERAIQEERDAKRAKTKAARERKQERVAAKRTALMGDDEEAAAAEESK
jgi:hypothetical protein